MGKSLESLAGIWFPIYFYDFYLCYQLGYGSGYHCMQFKRKLINQTKTNGENPNFGPDFGSFFLIQVPKVFFRGFYLYQMLSIVASCYSMQFQGKLIIQTQENGNKSRFGTNLGLFSPRQVRQCFSLSKIWLCQSLDIIVSYHHV